MCPLLKELPTGAIRTRRQSVFLMAEKIVIVALPRHFVLLCSLGLIFGCSANVQDQPELGEVTGTVTMDDKPLSQALVVFSPESGRSSTAVTDDAGMYQLQYLHNVRGAVIGNHKVQITTYFKDEDSPQALKYKEKIPSRYNSKSTLTAMVEAGSNKHDFALKSK